MNSIQFLKGLTKVSMVCLSNAFNFSNFSHVLFLQGFQYGDQGEFQYPEIAPTMSAFDKHYKFHLNNKETIVSRTIVTSTEKFNHLKPFLGTPVRQKNGD